MVQRMRIRLGLYKYCGCNYCHTYAGTWRENHSDKKYTTPSFLRPFDGIKSLWELVA
jgi:hypothetical protein